jgi:hypothetical protein
VDPKVIFAKKKSGAYLITAKVQNYPGSREIGRSLRKIQNIPSKGATTKREMIYVSQVVDVSQDQLGNPKRKV